MGNCSLYDAIIKNNREKVESVISKYDEKSLNLLCGLDHYSILMDAVSKPYVDNEISEILLNHGADINKTNKYGYSPLIIAIANDNTKAAKFLIEKKLTLKSDNLYLERVKKIIPRLLNY